MRPPTTMPRIPALAPVLEGADHIDVKVVIGVVSLRAFLAASLGYQPGWMTGLYRVRAVFVRTLGMQHREASRASGACRRPRRADGAPDPCNCRSTTPVSGGSRGDIFRGGEPRRKAPFGATGSRDFHGRSGRFCREAHTVHHAFHHWRRQHDRGREWPQGHQPVDQRLQVGNG